MTQKNNVGAKVAAGIVGGLIVGGLVVGGYVDDSSEVKILTDKLAELENMPAPVAEITEIEVEVDNDNLEIVLNHIFDNDGNIDYLTDDLDDDEVEQITDRIVFINEIRDEAVKAIKSDLFDELDKLEITLADTSVVELDEDEMSRLRIDSDADELEVSEFNWDDKEATVAVTGTFRQDGVDFDFSADVLFEDGVFDELDNIIVAEQL